MEGQITNCFNDLFSASSSLDNLEFLLGLKGHVTNNINRELGKEFTTEEVYHALMQMHPTKASGPDEMLLAFYQRHWHIVEDSTTKTILSTLNSGEFPSELNHTYLSLIPKKSHPIKILDYHHISLCNVLYKLISKT